jgi:hypothetical protein
VSLPSWAWYGPDSPDKLLCYVEWYSEKFGTPGEANRCLQAVAAHFGPSGRFCMVTGRHPPRPFAGYAHVMVGPDLSWHAGSPSGIAPDDMRKATYNPYHRRGCVASDRDALTPEALALNVVHEVEHVVGLTHEDMLAPDRWAKTVRGLAACAAAARMWRAD